MAKVPAKKVPAKKATPKATVKKPATAPKKVAPKVVKAEIPILMRPSEPKVKKPKTKRIRKLLTPLEILFRMNSLSAVGIAFINALNGGLVVVTMLLMMIAFVTEIFVMVTRDYSEANEVIHKYSNFVKAKVKKKVKK
jgi:hypothetical protein